MLFVDGENLTIRAQETLETAELTPIAGKFWRKDTFIWQPQTSALQRPSPQLDVTAIRAYYYTSMVGDDLALQQVRRRLWDLQFTPQVFKKTRQNEKAKGVDISLTKDMLAHAFNDHYDVGVLMAGDGDYSPLVEELRRLGKRIVVKFFSETAGLNPELKLAADEYQDMTQVFVAGWKEALGHPEWHI
jgi:uncharacterized LabA/DUF88 family protein